MKLSLDTNTAAYMVRSYEPGKIRVNDEYLRESLVISSETLIRDWPPTDFDSLESAHIGIILELQPEIILLGTGQAQHFPEPALLREAIRHGIGVEVMDTGAACRTYNLLASEDRKVAAGLILD
jgi:uncharacterized protein